MRRCQLDPGACAAGHEKEKDVEASHGHTQRSGGCVLSWVRVPTSALGAPAAAMEACPRPCARRPRDGHTAGLADATNPLFSVVGRQGLEPWTYGLKARSSTD